MKKYLVLLFTCSTLTVFGLLNSQKVSAADVSVHGSDNLKTQLPQDNYISTRMYERLPDISGSGAGPGNFGAGSYSFMFDFGPVKGGGGSSYHPKKHHKH